MPLEIQARLFGLAEVAPVVELEILDLEIPVIDARPARGIHGILATVILRPEKIEPGRAAATLLVGKKELGIEKMAGLRVEAQLQFRAGEQVAVLEHSHTAGGGQFVLDIDVGDALGLDQAALLAQFGVALDVDHTAGLAADFLPLDEDRRIRGLFPLGQQAGFQFEHQVVCRFGAD